MYDLILHNNATKENFLYTGLTDSGERNFYLFEGFDIGDVPFGEYQYFLIWNELSGVTYTFKNVPLDTIVTAKGKDIQLVYLHPETGLLKYIDTDDETPSYRDKDTTFYYRRK